MKRFIHVSVCVFTCAIAPLNVPLSFFSYCVSVSQRLVLEHIWPLSSWIKLHTGHQWTGGPWAAVSMRWWLATHLSKALRARRRRWRKRRYSVALSTRSPSGSTGALMLLPRTSSSSSSRRKLRSAWAWGKRFCVYSCKHSYAVEESELEIQGCKVWT